MIEILAGDCRDTLKTLADQSINTCITSPPYWGLRDYGTAEWEGGDENCDHVEPSSSIKFKGRDDQAHTKKQYKKQCLKCGAIRKDKQLGMEDTPEEFVENLVQVFREVKRVLRDLGIKSPRMPDFKEAARVLHERGIEPRRTNGKKVYDISYEPIDDDTGGGGYNFGGAVDD